MSLGWISPPGSRICRGRAVNMAWVNGIGSAMITSGARRYPVLATRPRFAPLLLRSSWMKWSATAAGRATLQVGRLVPPLRQSRSTPRAPLGWVVRTSGGSLPRCLVTGSVGAVALTTSGGSTGIASGATGPRTQILGGLPALPVMGAGVRAPPVPRVRQGVEAVLMPCEREGLAVSSLLGFSSPGLPGRSFVIAGRALLVGHRARCLWAALPALLACLLAWLGGSWPPSPPLRCGFSLAGIDSFGWVSGALPFLA